MIFGLFQPTPDQEVVSQAYQSWRDLNPDNPSDDDFYKEDDNSEDDNSEDDSTDETDNIPWWKGWL